MNNDGVEERAKGPVGATNSAPGGYNFLLRISRQLGGVATKSSFVHDVRNFMSQPITYDSPAKWWDTSVARLRGEPSQQAQPSTVSDQQQKNDDAQHRKNTEEQRHKDLRKIVSQSHEVLVSANTVFPLSLFPDTVTVDRTKVTITKRDFFWSSDVMSIRIEDVLNVSASVGPLFGSLTVASRVMSTIDHFQINHFWRNDAIRLKHIIQGYVIAQHNNIDTAHLNKKDLIDTLLELGLDSN